MKLVPFNEALTAAMKLREDKNTLVYQQFQCANCKTKQTIEDPEHFYTTGRCEECGHVTDIEKDGCNYMLVSAISSRAIASGLIEAFRKNRL